MRSANAPVIKAGVMMANVIWNMMNTHSGIVAASEFTVVLVTPLSIAFDRLPI